MKMPGESLKSEKSDPIPMAAARWPTLMKKNAADEQQQVVMKAKKNVNAKEMMISNKPKTVDVESKKATCICICSPTSHAGSFRCHLHRCSASAAVANSTKGRRENSPNKLKPNKLHGQQPSTLSRFGRASASASLKLNPCGLSAQ